MTSRAIRSLVALVLLVSTVGCIEVQRSVTEVDVTPGTVPEEIRGARWQSLPIAYCLVPDEVGFVPAERLAQLASDAFTAWGVDVSSEGDCDQAERGNGRNEISWGLTEGAAGDAEADTEDAGVFQAGYTFQRFRGCPGGCEGGAQSQIIEADILLSPSPPDRFRNEECLFSTLLHEAGHVLGVPHLEPPAVMAPATGDCPQELTEADRQALGDLYGDEAAEG